MARISDTCDLSQWLHDKPLEAASLIAGRIALRITPLLRVAVGEDEDSSWTKIVLPCLHALDAVRVSSAEPRAFSDRLQSDRHAVRTVLKAIVESENRVQMEIFDWGEIADEVPEGHMQLQTLREEARNLSAASSAIDAIHHAVQASINVTCVRDGIASPKAVVDSVVSGAKSAEQALDEVLGNFAIQLLDLDENPERDVDVIPNYTTQFWRAIEQDATNLESIVVQGDTVKEGLEQFSHMALWIEEIPVWTTRAWMEFTNRLPREDAWAGSIDWYESLLAGRLAKSVPLTATRKYQVALSFAGEQREYVHAVAAELEQRSIKVFYDDFERTSLWGQDGVSAFHRIFAGESEYVVMFISNAYLNKEWPQHERRSALSRMIMEKKEYVLPVKFDDSSIPGLPSSTLFLEADDYEPAQLAEEILTKLRNDRA